MPSSPNSVHEPPASENPQGESRRVGVEIEFTGLTPEAASKLVAACFGGTVKQGVNRYVFEVQGTEWGTFHLELDTRFVHPQNSFGDLVEKSGVPLSEKVVDTARNFDTQMRELIGEVSIGLVPAEIVSPPIPWHELGRLDKLVDALRNGGAKGTDEGPAYSFGVHLNPEIAQENTEYCVSILQAYVLLSPWLRERIDIDTTRKILPHIDPFTEDYVKALLAPDFNPDLASFIRHYYAHNPTRNRELDLLPLFKHMASDILGELTDDERIKARPTFHYRLPDTRFSDPNWSIAQEWNRWVTVERLAADTQKLEQMKEQYLNDTASGKGGIFRDMTKWIDNLTNP